MQAQVRTIVAVTGERLVVLPEADYAALVSAAGNGGANHAATPDSLLAAMPAVNAPERRLPAKAPVKAAAAAAPVVSAAAVAVAPTVKAAAPARQGCSLEDVLLFG